MIVDACRRLTALDRLDNYQYVGFGGLEFLDFVEVHLGLGVHAMTSIERSLAEEPRFLFNKPYDSINLLMGDARARLADVDWSSRRAIIWLDYCDQLTTNVLRDVDYVARSARPGSVLIVSVNAGVSTKVSDRLPNLKKNLGALVNPSLSDRDMKSWGAAREQKRILSQHASSSCREAHGEPIQQLFDFHYADASPMQTWGGLIADRATTTDAARCRFEDLDFVRRDNEEPLEIKVPFLTDREMSYVLQGVVGDAVEPVISGVSKQDIEHFRAVYRYRAGLR
jgi:hypothetical protein